METRQIITNAVRYIFIDMIFTSTVTLCFLLATGEPLCKRTAILAMLYGVLLGASHKMSYELSNGWEGVTTAILKIISIIKKGMVRLWDSIRSTSTR